MCERVAGATGIVGIMSGLREMKAWAAAHDPSFRYGARSMKFTFANAAKADEFRAVFGEAE